MRVVEEEGETVSSRLYTVVFSLRHKCQVSSDPASSESLANLQFHTNSYSPSGTKQSSQKRDTNLVRQLSSASLIIQPAFPSLKPAKHLKAKTRTKLGALSGSTFVCFAHKTVAPKLTTCNFQMNQQHISINSGWS